MNILSLQISALACLLCSCATQSPTHLSSTAETSINRNAGRGEHLVATLRIQDGIELPMIVDTGAPCLVILDKSLEWKLGKRHRTAKIGWPAGKTVGGVYTAPKLYLGGVELVTGPRVATMDMKLLGVAAPALGLVGLDCLRHYCVQFDFSAGKMRLLDPNDASSGDLGKAFPLYPFKRCFGVTDNLLGGTDAKSVIDTGCNYDGELTPRLFQQWTNQARIPSDKTTHRVHFPDGELGGNSYTNLYLTGDGRFNSIGLNLLARNLVTLNFPKRMMYLKQQSVGSLGEGNGYFDKFYWSDLREH